MAKNLHTTTTCTIQVQARGYAAAADKAVATLDMDGRDLAEAPELLSSEEVKKFARAFYIVPENGAYPEDTVTVTRVTNDSYTCEIRCRRGIAAGPAKKLTPAEIQSKSDEVCEAIWNADSVIKAYCTGLCTTDEMFAAVDAITDITGTAHKMSTYVDTWMTTLCDMSETMVDYLEWLDTDPYHNAIELHDPTWKMIFEDYLRSQIVTDKETGYERFLGNMYAFVPSSLAYAKALELVKAASRFDELHAYQYLIDSDGPWKERILVSILQVYNTAVDEILCDMLDDNNARLYVDLMIGMRNNAV